MSINMDWDALTGGEDGAHLAEKIRAFVHDKFQTIQLPRMIRSVQVHSFEFGKTPPEIVVKDVCDPLPDFYEDEESDTPEKVEQGSGRGLPDRTSHDQSSSAFIENVPRRAGIVPASLHLQTATASRHRPLASLAESVPLRSGTPGMMGGGMSNLGYFHLPLSAGLSGTSTPLAAVAGAHYPNWNDATHTHGREAGRDRTDSHGSVTPPSIATPTSRPTSRHHEWQDQQEGQSISEPGASILNGLDQRRETSPDDLQVIAHIAYDGDVKLSMTAEILLDYPTESFVGIPLLLNMTGLRFDGIGILAYIKKKAHFCFLAPEDAEAVLEPGDSMGTSAERPRVGALIEEIRLESEVGQQEGGKQVLKNVGKIEKFILEQVRRIFEDEFVYPSFWTFLV